MSEALKEGIVSRNKGDLDGAIIIFKKLIETNPSEKDAYDLIGSCYFLEESWNEAIDAFKKFDELEPENMRIHVSIGRAHAHLEQWPAALEHFQKAVNILDSTLPANLPNFELMKRGLQVKLAYVQEKMDPKMTWLQKWWNFGDQPPI
jgi:tetratricopeptide (TPR) repeat protein